MQLQQIKINGVWQSHSHGISMQVAVEHLNLKIEDFGEQEKLSKAVRGYYRLLVDFMGKYSVQSIIHTQKRYTPLAWKLV